MKFLPDRSNILSIKRELARWLNLAAMDLARLFDAFDQFVEQFLFHLSSWLTTLRNAFFSPAERSSRSDFEYITNR